MSDAPAERDEEPMPWWERPAPANEHPEAEARRLISLCTDEDWGGLSSGEVVFLANVLADKRKAERQTAEAREIIDGLVKEYSVKLTGDIISTNDPDSAEDGEWTEAVRPLWSRALSFLAATPGGER